MIAIDTTFLGHDEVKSRKPSLSTSIFTVDLLDAFIKLNIEKNFCLLVNYNHEGFFKERFPQYRQLIIKCSFLTLIYRITGKPFTKLLKKLGVFKSAVKRNNFDAIWFPYTVPMTYVKTNLPTLITIHDILQFHKGNGKIKSIYKKIINDEKNSIVSISNYTKSDILKSIGCNKEIRVIPNSIKFDISKTKKILAINHKFILDINAYDPKKNTLTLLQAFFKIANKTSLDLVLCGGYKKDEYFEKIMSFIKEYQLEDRVHVLFRVTDEERNWLLKNAEIFVTPSLFEGFGRTPVEAAVCGIPVISTKETALYEATCGLVHYVKDARNSNEYADLILSVLNNNDSKEDLWEISKILRNEYIDVNCASKYSDIFKILISNFETVCQ